MMQSADDAGDSDTESTSLLGNRTEQSSSVLHTQESNDVPSTTTSELSAIYKSRWRSIRVVYLVMFLGSVTFTITMSSLWPFLQVLNPTASTSFLGWVVAAYSLGQLSASPIFGGWANRRNSSREPLVVSLILTVLSNIFYMYLESMPDHRHYYMILARGLIGFSAGNVAVVRSYVSGATTVQERTSSMANLSIFQAMGFILGPVIQAALVPISYPGPVDSVYFHFNMYTAPAFLAGCVAIIAVVLLVFVFNEHRVVDDDIKAILQSTSSDIEDQSIMTNAGLTDSLRQLEYKPDYVAVVSSIFLFFVVLFMFTVFETIGTPLTMDMYAWSKTKATLYQGIILGVAGVLSIIVFLFVKILARRYSERYLLLGGFIFCLCGYFTFIPWGSQLPPIGFAPINNTVSSSEAIYTLSNYLINGDRFENVNNGGHRFSKRDASFMKYNPELVYNFFELGPGYYSDVYYDDALDTDNKSDIVGRPSFVYVDGPVKRKVQETVLSSVLLARRDVAELYINLSSTTGSIITGKVDVTTGTFHSVDSTSSSHSTDRRSYSADTTSHSADTTSHSADTTNHSADTTSHSAVTTSHSAVTTSHSISHSTALTTNSTIAPNGCPWQYAWCRNVPVIYLGQFLGGTVLISIGYPVCNMLSYALYSKVLGPKPQGLWMGWLTASGSLARTVGPIYVSQVYDSFGPQITFASCCGLIVLTIIFYLVVFRRMVPFSFHNQSLNHFESRSGVRSVN